MKTQSFEDVRRCPVASWSSDLGDKLRQRKFPSLAGHCSYNHHLAHNPSIGNQTGAQSPIRPHYNYPTHAGLEEIGVLPAHLPRNAGTYPTTTLRQYPLFLTCPRLQLQLAASPEHALRWRDAGKKKSCQEGKGMRFIVACRLA